LQAADRREEVAHPVAEDTVQSEVQTRGLVAVAVVDSDHNSNFEAVVDRGALRKRDVEAEKDLMADGHTVDQKMEVVAGIDAVDLDKVPIEALEVVDFDMDPNMVLEAVMREDSMLGLSSMWVGLDAKAQKQLGTALELPYHEVVETEE
jgi:hypothetical protein